MSAGQRNPSTAPPGADDDPSIPLLTDRIYLPAVELDMALPAASAAASPEQAAVPSEADEVADAAPLVSSSEPAAERQASGSDEVLSAAKTAVIAAAAAGAGAGAASDQTTASADAAQDSEPQPAISAHADETATAEVVVAIEAPQPLAGDERAEPSTIPDPLVAPPAAMEAIEAQAEAVRTAVLQRVAERLPEQVNAAVRDLMQPAIDQAMARLGEEAQVALRITLQDLVEQVLREELARRNTGEAPR